jgi:hypothetical protein
MLFPILAAEWLHLCISTEYHNSSMIVLLKYLVDIRNEVWLNPFGNTVHKWKIVWNKYEPHTKSSLHVEPSFSCFGVICLLWLATDDNFFLFFF